MTGAPNGEATGLGVDFYLLVLAAVYHADGLWGEATFDLTLRRGAPAAPWAVVAGVHEAVDAVLGLTFDDEQVDWLRQQAAFGRSSDGWWQSLRHFRFTGDIHAMPEGTLAFPGEPVLRVTAPLQQATLIQTLLMQPVSLGMGVATRAARARRVAGDRRLYDFSFRHAGALSTSQVASRAALAGGFFATSNTAAARALGVPPMGTLSSDFFAAYQGADAALEAFSVHFPDVGFVNLPPGRVGDAVKALLPYGDHIRIVRVDHPELARASRVVRQVLDRAGLEHVLILGSGTLDEARIAALGDAPVDLLAMGKALVQGRPASLAYRLAQMWRGPDPEPVQQPGAARFPGAKQVMRFSDHDRLVLLREVAEAQAEGGRPLLEPLVERGARVGAVPSVRDSAARCLAQVEALGPIEDYPVRASAALAALAKG